MNGLSSMLRILMMTSVIAA